MATALVILGAILLLVGIAGCVLPLLPGPPLSFLALLIQQLNSPSPFSTKFLLIWAGITLVVTILDYLIPVYGTKKFGGSPDLSGLVRQVKFSEQISQISRH